MANVGGLTHRSEYGIQNILILGSQTRDGQGSLHAKNVTFITMPTIPDPANTNRLLPEEPEDDLIWRMLQTGTLWHGKLPAPPASTVDVRVLNGAGIAGLAARTAASLKKLGFRVTRVGDAPAAASTTISYANPNVGARP